MGGGGRGGCSFDACYGHLTIEHVSLSKRSTAPSSNRDTSDIWVIITFFSCVT